MSSMMIIKSGRKKEMYICPVTNCIPESEDMMISEFYSRNHARDKGWRFTNHIKFCPPEEDIVAVCPECAKDYDWKEEAHA